MNALARAEAAMPARMGDALDAVIEAGAAIMLKQRWRIIRALRPGAPAMWEAPVDLTALLDEARFRIAQQERAGRAGHYAFDPNRLIALRQAERALTALAETASRAACGLTQEASR